MSRAGAPREVELSAAGSSRSLNRPGVLSKPEHAPRGEREHAPDQGPRTKDQGLWLRKGDRERSAFVSTPRERADDTDAMDERIDRWRAGMLDPIPVALNADVLPKRATALRRLVNEIAFWIGLRLADFEYRDVPLSQRCRSAHGLLCLREPLAAPRALQMLVERGVLGRGKSLPPHGGWRGTNAFRPPEPLATGLGCSAAGDHPLERWAAVIESAVAHPLPKVEDEPSMDRGESGIAAPGDDLGMVATGHSTAEGSGGWHRQSLSPTAGGLEMDPDLGGTRSESLLDPGAARNPTPEVSTMLWPESCDSHVRHTRRTGIPRDRAAPPGRGRVALTG